MGTDARDVAEGLLVMGLCGALFYPGGGQSTGQRPVALESVKHMAAAAPYRAPAGVSYWEDETLEGVLACLNHGTGRAPQLLRQGNLVVVAHARIDNRTELSGCLEDLSDPSNDAAFILAAYRRWGEACPGELIGDFAFVIWDTERKRVFAARDPMAARPFYYLLEPGRFLFASEVQQLLAVPGLKAELFEPAVAAHLAGVGAALDETFYRGIKQLPPAHILTLEAGKLRTWRGWDIDPGKRVRYPQDEDYSEAFRNLFVRAVKDRLRGTGDQVGLSLSGGVDSSGVGAVMGWLARQESGPQIYGYSWAFDSPDLTGGDERHVSGALAAHYGFKVRDIPADDAWPLSHYPEHGPDRDDPLLWFTQTLVDRGLYLAAGDEVTTLFSGHGGDELVGDWVYGHAEALRAGRFGLLWRDHQTFRRRTGNGWLRSVKRLHFPEGLSRRVPPSSPDWLQPAFAERAGLADIVASSRLPFKGVSPAQTLRYARIFGGAASRIAVLEERRHARYGLDFVAPWRDRRLAEFVLAVPPWRVQSLSNPKELARQALHELMPESVRTQMGTFTQDALYDKGIKDEARGLVEDLLKTSRSAERGFVDADALLRSYHRGLEGEEPHDLWWPLTLEWWLRRYWA